MIAFSPEPVSSPVLQKPEIHHLAATERGQDLKAHREHEDEQDADQEGRQRDADQRHCQEHLREPGLRLERGIDAHRDPEHQGEQRGNRCELDRCRKPLGDQLGDRPLELIGDAEIEMQRVPYETHELHEYRVVQAERLAQLIALLEAGLDPDHLVDGIADETEERECNQGHHQDDQDGFEGAADDEGEHVASPSPGRAAQSHMGAERDLTSSPGERGRSSPKARIG